MAKAFVDLDITGTRELQAQLDRLVGDVNAELAEAVDAGLEPVLQAARRRAPVKRGVLRDGIVKKMSRTKKAGSASGTVGLTRKAMHGVPVELGHNIVRDGKVVGHVPAHPFLRPAMDENRDTAERIIRQKLGQKIDGVARG